MNASQYHKVLAVLEKLKKININGVVKAIYKAEAINSVIIANVTLERLIGLLKEFIFILDNTFQTDKWKAMSFYDNTNKAIDIEGVLQTITDRLSSRTPFEDWYGTIIWLDEYGMRNGLWAETSIYEVRGIDGNLLFEEARRNLAEVGILKSQLAAYKNESIQINAQQVAEYESLKRSQAASQEALTRIRSAELESVGTISKLNEAYEQMLQNGGHFHNTLEEARKALQAIHDDEANAKQYHETSLGELKNISNELNGIVSSAKEKEESILSQKNEIAELRGLAADAALGGVFGKRRDDLDASVLLWTRLSIVSFVIAVSWIAYALKDYNTTTITTVNWPILLVNFFRTTPAIALVAFCLKQYSKERDLQEEYAFKAAVSTTVTAYSSMISDEKERIKMLISVLTGVYVPPTIKNTSAPFSFNSKHLADAGKSAVEVAKSMQTAVTDVTKAVKSSDKDEKEEKEK